MIAQNINSISKNTRNVKMRQSAQKKQQQQKMEIVQNYLVSIRIGATQQDRRSRVK